MLRLSSQSKSMPTSRVAVCSATGMCTSPNVMTPFHNTRGLSVAMVCSCSRLRTLGGSLESQTLHRIRQGLAGLRVVAPRILARLDALVGVGDGPVVAPAQRGELVPAARDRHAYAGARARRERRCGGRA